MTSPLAIHGGEPVLLSPPPWPSPDEEVREALQTAYAAGDWGKYQGPHHADLVELLAAMHQVRFAFPCCSGTFAVELALRALRIEAGQEVILAGYDFGGNFRAVEAIGAVPVLIDIVPDTWCLDVDQVESAIGPQTRAIIVSHLHGGIAPMPRLRQIADRHGLVVVEDACQAPGALVHGRVAGTWGDVGVLSFGGSKLLTAGRGGALVTNQEPVWQRAKIYCERGNHAFPLSELQAAVLVPQLAKLPASNVRRRHSVDYLHAQMKTLAAMQPLAAPPPDSSPSYFKLPWRYRPKFCGDWTREQFIAAVQAEGVALDAGFRGFVRRGTRCRRVGTLPHSTDAAESTTLLHHPVLLENNETLLRVSQAIHKVVAAALARL